MTSEYSDVQCKSCDEYLRVFRNGSSDGSGVRELVCDDPACPRYAVTVNEYGETPKEADNYDPTPTNEDAWSGGFAENH